MDPYQQDMGLDLSNPGTKVFIGNVAWSTTNETLSDYLAQQGTPGAPAPPRHTACPHTPPLSRVRAVFPRLCARRAFALHGPLPIVRRPRGASESASVRRAKPVPWPRQARRVHRQAHPADYYFWLLFSFFSHANACSRHCRAQDLGLGAVERLGHCRVRLA